MRFEKGALAAVGLIAALTFTLSAWNQTASDQTAEVERLDRELSAAGVRGDLQTSSHLIGDTAVFVSASGKTTTKADNLAFMKSADYKLESENFDDIHSKQFGDTVVLWGRATAKGTYQQKPIHETFNFTDVWQKHNGSWQQVFTRATPIVTP